jgi:L-lactate dehydrogenase complex protein LldE
MVDQLYPEVGEATAKVLERAGCEVEYREAQTCCGQPGFNAGFRREARWVAERFVRVFHGAEVIVTPSGSCASMVRRFYPELFAGDPKWADRVKELGARTFELSEFLVKERGLTAWPGSTTLTVAYHDSCHLKRELGVADEPRRLIASVKGVKVVELPGADQCCGFGGLFSVKFPELSTAILADKLDNVARAAPDVVLTGDAGCLSQIQGGLARRQGKVRALHVAQFLAEVADEPDA